MKSIITASFTELENRKLWSIKYYSDNRYMGIFNIVIKTSSSCSFLTPGSHQIAVYKL